MLDFTMFFYRLPEMGFGALSLDLGLVRYCWKGPSIGSTYFENVLAFMLNNLTSENYKHGMSAN